MIDTSKCRKKVSFFFWISVLEKEKEVIKLKFMVEQTGG